MKSCSTTCFVSILALYNQFQLWRKMCCEYKDNRLQEKITGAMFVILLFITGARSFHKRRISYRARCHQLGAGGANSKTRPASKCFGSVLKTSTGLRGILSIRAIGRSGSGALNRRNRVHPLFLRTLLINPWCAFRPIGSENCCQTCLN